MCLLCLAPLVCMAVAKTDATTEKRTLAPFPSLTTEEGKLNKDFFDGFDEYFNDHFAFRNLLVSADSAILGRLFQTSSNSTILVGKDDWLYYTATLNDYNATSPLSDRALFCIANNLSLLQSYVEAQNSAFLFTVAPNKNTLYDEHMPYHQKVNRPVERNLDRLLPYLEQCGVHYTELRDLFSDPAHPLYYARDSHWNNRGARLVFNRLCETLQWPHDTYEAAEPKRDEAYIGDLEQMLYPLWGRGERNETFDDCFSFTYGSRFESVEDPIIESTSDSKEGSLLMYRDSFGNALIPFFADTFRNGSYYKTQPYNAAAHMLLEQPDVVIAEKVERNLADYLKYPPVIPATECVIDSTRPQAGNSTLTAENVTANTAYFALQGVLDESLEIPADSRIYISLSDGDTTTTVEAFGQVLEGKNAFVAFFERSTFPASSYEATLILGGKENLELKKATVEIPAAEILE